MKKTISVEASANVSSRECITLQDAAKYLICSQGTLMNWISAKKFTEADGLRRVGGLSRVHFPTLRARFADGTLMMTMEQSRPAKPKRRNARLDLYEALRATDSELT